jgi:NAD(P)H-dependent FMN reductase
MKFLIIVGTTREGRKTINAAKTAVSKFSEEGHETVLYDLKEKDIPYLGNRRYVDSEKPVPEDIEELGQEVETADCVVIITPEYNHSIPGVLKNALDYLYPEYEDKPFAYVTDSAGGFGGVRALSHLHDITLALGAFPGPNIQVSNIGSKYEEGELVDEELSERFDDFVSKTEEYVNKIN